jgi:hypothetical protein
MNLQIKAHGHTLHFELQNNMVATDLVPVFCVAFLAEQQLHLQLEIITCMKMSKKH